MDPAQGLRAPDERHPNRTRDLQLKVLLSEEPQFRMRSDLRFLISGLDHPTLIHTFNGMVASLSGPREGALYALLELTLPYIES
jgi:hypothetical protein